MKSNATTISILRHNYTICQYAVEMAKDGNPELLMQIRERPDWQVELNPVGITQSIATGQWIKQNGLAFDAGWCGFAVRHRQTAFHLGIDVEWQTDPRLDEMYWGGGVG